MKKLLLLFVALIMGVSSIFAQELIYTLTPEKGTNNDYTKNCDITIDDITWNMSGNASILPWRLGGKSITNTDRTVYNKTALNNAANKVVLTIGAMTIQINSAKLLVSNSSDFSNAEEIPFTVTANKDVTIESTTAGTYFKFVFNYTNTGGSNKYMQFSEAKFYQVSSEGAVAAPTITLGENNMVEISQKDGADIYYTTDGEDPTTSSTQYTAPFEITDVTTVKAIAVLDGVESAVTSKELKPNTVTSISKFIELENTIDDTKINTPLTAIYQCGRNLYLTDGTDYLLAYNGNNVAAVSNLAAENGDVISYISGAYKSQAGLPEIIPSAVGEKSAGTAVEPNEYAIEEISSSMLNEYVKISGLNIVAASSDNNYTATDETGSIVIYNTFNNAKNYPEAITQPDGTKNNTVPEGEGFTVYGFVSCFNSTLQITPIKFEGGTVMGHAATPTFDPESGSELSVGDLISIDCATEGAKIYYTTNGDTPTAESTEYTAPIEFTEACTIKAIAVAEGYLDSDVATATYSLYVEGEKSYTFDFTTYGNVGSLANTELLAPSSSVTTTPIDGVSFNYGPVQLSYYTANHSNKTSPAWFYYNSKTVTECRVYKANQFDVFLTQNGYKITKIEFTQNSGSTTWAASNVTTNLSEESTSMSGKTWEAPASGMVNKVTFVPTGTIRFATMTVNLVEDSNGVMEIEGIGTDNSNAPVEYYNIQGIRVNEGNLTPGLYIRRQGTEATKVFINK